MCGIQAGECLKIQYFPLVIKNTWGNSWRTSLILLSYSFFYISIHRPNVILCIAQTIIKLVIPILPLHWMELAVVSDMYVSRISKPWCKQMYIA